ncbi:hypothetical protein E2C01_082246 [Portunus trituberculatus]|uniref:Uncharacterized protein n=1 Tax=Portunus trituberculatus TaxID=210409 RepID=A0A5B7J0A8_PORTR|nr:hypothetical protein [Portunus trituberculatus]
MRPGRHCPVPCAAHTLTCTGRRPSPPPARRSPGPGSARRAGGGHCMRGAAPDGRRCHSPTLH